MELQVESATEDDKGELAGFSCSTESPSEPWAQEAENFIRGWVVNHSEKVLLFRTMDAQIAAVTAFSSRQVEVPILEPQTHAGWHLDVVGVATELQGAGIGRLVIGSTFDEMRSVKPERVLVTATVHKENAAAMRCAASVGLTPLIAKDAHYWVLLAELN